MCGCVRGANQFVPPSIISVNSLRGPSLICPSVRFFFLVAVFLCRSQRSTRATSAIPGAAERIALFYRHTSRVRASGRTPSLSYCCRWHSLPSRFHQTLQEIDHAAAEIASPRDSRSVLHSQERNSLAYSVWWKSPGRLHRAYNVYINT